MSESGRKVEYLLYFQLIFSIHLKLRLCSIQQLGKSFDIKQKQIHNKKTVYPMGPYLLK